MNTQELKQQAHKEFDGRFAGATDAIYHYETGVLTPQIKSFIDSIIDRTVQATEERIANRSENVIATLSAMRIKESSLTPKGELWIAKDSLITNKSNINKQ